MYGSRSAYAQFYGLTSLRSYALESYLPMPNRILIVDDEPLNLDLLDQELTEMGHVTENGPLNGAEALSKARHRQSGSRFAGLSDAGNEWH